MKKPAIIGAAVPSPEAGEKVTGRAIFTNDIKLPGMLYGAILRSPYAHARIKSIDVSPARELPGVKDVIIGADMPPAGASLARDKVRFTGEPVAAVAAIDPATALKALERIAVEYEELPGVFSAQDAVSEGAPLIHDDSPGNLILTHELAYGDLDDAFARSDLIREDAFTLGAASPANLEPCSSLAQPDGGGGVTLWTSASDPRAVQSSLAVALGLAESRVRVIRPPAGGSSGTGMGAGDFCAALMALRAGRPVKITLTRREEAAFGRRGPAMTIRCKTGFTKDGLITGKHCEVLLDGGAHDALGQAAFSGASLGAMPYRCPAYRYEGRLVHTNQPPAGAGHGLGAAQMLFALESQMNLAAGELGLDPIELRLKNALQEGEVIPELGTVGPCGFKESLAKVRELSGWDQKRKKTGEGYGIGVGCYCAPCGGAFMRPDAKYSAASAEVRALADGSLHLLTLAADCGAELRQILAAELGVGLESIRLTSGDTALTPQAAPGGGDGVFMTGNAVIDAAQKIKGLLAPVAAAELGLEAGQGLGFDEGRVFSAADPGQGMGFAECVAKAYEARSGEPLCAVGVYTPPDEAPAFSFGAQVAEARVDLDTGQVAVSGIYAAYDCGQAVNPLAVEARMQGSMQRGLGYALMEEPATAQGGAHYKLASALDVPPSQMVRVETFEPRGPHGAKDCGQGPMGSTAAAIAGAVASACGCRCPDLPITPEKVLKGLGKLR